MQATVNIYGKQQPARGREPTYSGQWCTDDGSFCLLCNAFVTDQHLMSEKHTKRMRAHKNRWTLKFSL